MPTNKSPGLGGFIGDSAKHLKKLIPILVKLFQKKNNAHFG